MLDLELSVRHVGLLFLFDDKSKVIKSKVFVEGINVSIV